MGAYHWGWGNVQPSDAPQPNNGWKGCKTGSVHSFHSTPPEADAFKAPSNPKAFPSLWVARPALVGWIHLITHWTPFKPVSHPSHLPQPTQMKTFQLLHRNHKEFPHHEDLGQMSV